VAIFALGLFPSLGHYFFAVRYPCSGKSSSHVPDEPGCATRNKFLRLCLAIVHSFNTLTPGIELDSLENYFSHSSGYMFPKDKRLIFAAMETAQKVLGWYLIILFGILFGKIWIR
jgi:hypothetical protein